MQDTQANEISSRESVKAKKVRGKNICKIVSRLKPSEKLRVTFYQNRVVGQHSTSFSRNLGILVRDHNMCPLRVHSWKDIEKYKLQHMWDAITDKFDSDDMNTHKKHVLQNMRRLWNNWRGSLHKNMKSKPFCYALEDVPKEVDKSDWKWLVKEHFLSEKFKVEIQKLVQSESSLTNIEIVEKGFGPQCKSHVVGFGGGITAKELKGGNSSKASLLDKLNASEKENESLKILMDELENKCARMDELESKYERSASAVFGHLSSPPSSSDQ